MIKSITINNYILIDKLSIDFQSGLTVFTGETGAGKSIIISAVDVALGSKISKDAIKQGQEKAYIELTVSLDSDFDTKILTDNGIEIINNELVISREILPSTSRSRINGILVTQDFIKEIREFLIDIHTQHQNYNYLKQKTHITLLDSFGNSDFKELLLQYKTKYQNYLETQRRLEQAKNAVNISEQQIEFLKFQIQDIETVNIEDKEEDECLKQELEILSNAERLKELSYSSYWGIYGDDGNIVDSLLTIKMNISKLVQTDNSLDSTLSDLSNVQEQLKDIAHRLRDYSESKETDEQRINEIQERLFNLDKLKRKYGGSLEKVLENYNSMIVELEAVTNSQSSTEELEKLKQEEEQELNALALNLSSQREEYAQTLGNAVETELEKLELPKVQFKIDVQRADLNENGVDRVEFLISTNVSEPLRPIEKVASGGEISRVMLALKTVFAKCDKTATVIFDEIDTGISGKVAQSVAESISDLSKYHQVMLITHQPIIAAKANSHFYVTKDQDTETHVKVYNLRDENRVKAVALLAAGEINDQSMSFAKTLIENNSQVLN